MKLILLPGLDGTGKLFYPLIQVFPASIEYQIISYPQYEEMSYIDIISYVYKQLPKNEDYIIVAESFSANMNITSDSDLGKEIKKHLNNLMTQQCKEITQEAQVCGLYTTTKKNNDIDFTNNQKLFSLGNSNLTTSALCMNGKCLLAFEIKDAFIDAKDINDSVPGNQDYWLSSPYDIYYSSTMNCWQ